MILLEEFDETKTAVINPNNMVERIPNMPKIAIACFSHILFEKIVSGGKCSKITELNNTNLRKEIYEIEYKQNKFAIFMMSIGAPAASADIEELHALGVEKFIVFGNCGVLDSSIEDCSVIIPTEALRDEGTSFHYQKPSKSIKLNTKYMNEFKEILDNLNFKYTEGISWTTDAFYRETQKKIEERKKSGAIVVEMESAALQAVANFRQVDLFIFFYAGDNLAAESWDKRSFLGDIKLDEKSQIAYLALELANKIKNV